MNFLKAMMVGAAMIVTGSAIADDYNRVSISYDYVYYTGAEFNTNGFGLNYMHGFNVIKHTPVYIETGGSLNFNFYGESVFDSGIKVKSQYQNFNIKVPLNISLRLHDCGNYYISPFAGINFQLNYIERERAGMAGEWTDWESLLNDDYGWNVFQMGWQAGINLQYKSYFIGAQVGTSFIPSKGDKDKQFSIKLHNTCVKASIGYEF